MNERLGAQHISALFALMGAARGISNNELQELAGFRIDGQLRRTLNERHLVISTRQGNEPFVHELTDAGWKRCEAELAGERPDGSGHLGGAFYMVLDGLAHFLRRENKVLTQVFQPEPNSAARNGFDHDVKDGAPALRLVSGNRGPLAGPPPVANPR
jgi:hypothetical protein